MKLWIVMKYFKLMLLCVYMCKMLGLCMYIIHICWSCVSELWVSISGNTWLIDRHKMDFCCTYIVINEQSSSKLYVKLNFILW